MLQIACWFYFSDIKPSIIINQKVQIYQPLNSHIGLGLYPNYIHEKQ